MYEVAFAPEAEVQLIDLYDYIAAAASPEIAANYMDALCCSAKVSRHIP
jgi:plasmid stabilization system protein ParE